MKIITDERCTDYHSPGHPERPARITGTVDKLKAQNELEIEWATPAEVDPKTLLLAHPESHLERIRAAADDFDGDTPSHPGIYDHALRSVGGAMEAMSAGLAGQPSFSLLRPPGHHAMSDRAMGFCYLSTVAIATLSAAKTLGRKVAVFDFDVHHGNGTEAILLDQPETAFFSIHQHPCYPGTGTEDRGQNCFNYPTAPFTPREKYREQFQAALDRLVKFKPDLVAVSAGFDAYARDPLAQETLEAEDFHWLGESLRQLDIPFFSCLEGGYSGDLPELILAYLKGVEGGG